MKLRFLGGVNFFMALVNDIKNNIKTNKAYKALEKEIGNQLESHFYYLNQKSDAKLNSQDEDSSMTICNFKKIVGYYKENMDFSYATPKLDGSSCVVVANLALSKAEKQALQSGKCDSELLAEILKGDFKNNQNIVYFGEVDSDGKYVKDSGSKLDNNARIDQLNVASKLLNNGFGEVLDQKVGKTCENVYHFYHTERDGSYILEDKVKDYEHGYISKDEVIKVCCYTEGRDWINAFNARLADSGNIRMFYADLKFIDNPSDRNLMRDGILEPETLAKAIERQGDKDKCGIYTGEVDLNGKYIKGTGEFFNNPDDYVKILETTKEINETARLNLFRIDREDYDLDLYKDFITRMYGKDLVTPLDAKIEAGLSEQNEGAEEVVPEE